MSHNTDTPTNPTATGQPGSEPPAPLPFLCLRDTQTHPRPDLSRTLPDGPRAVAEQALDAIDSISRRIDDLARELNLLGYFEDDDPDRPRAA